MWLSLVQSEVMLDGAAPLMVSPVSLDPLASLLCLGEVGRERETWSGCLVVMGELDAHWEH